MNPQDVQPLGLARVVGSPRETAGLALLCSSSYKLYWRLNPALPDHVPGRISIHSITAQPN